MSPTHDLYIFFCSNIKPEGKPCCGGEETEHLYNYCRRIVAENKSFFKAQGRVVKVNQSGCLGHCRIGPNIVIFPDNIWYRCHSEKDIDRILNEHVMNGHPVEELINPELQQLP